MTLRLLGGFEITAADGRDLTPPGRKVRALLAFLALSPRSGRSREELSTLFWGDRDESQARASLRQALAELRRALGGSAAIYADRETVTLDGTAVWVDAVQFERLAKADDLEHASELYVGELLGGITVPSGGFADWLSVERMRFNDLAVGVLARLVALQGGEIAIGTAQRLLQFDPVREKTHRTLMSLYDSVGQREQALRQYQICRDRLQRELGVQPEPETHQLFKELQLPSKNVSSTATAMKSVATALERPPSLDPEGDTRDARLQRADTPSAAKSVIANVPGPRRWNIGFALVVLVGAAAVASFDPIGLLTSSPFATTAVISPAPSIAVLPFGNRSNDAGLDYFADGVTETMITGLSRSPFVRVIAGTSTAAYRGNATDVREIGRELGVPYVLRGSVQRGPDRLRIVAQLFDTSTGEGVWAERYDRDGIDPLALQDDISEKVIGTIAGNHGLIKKREYEQTWGRDQAALQEYDYYLRGHQLFDRVTKEDTHRAIAVWQEGLDRFPSSSLLRIKLGWGYFQLFYGGWSNDPAEDLSRAFDLAEQGLADMNLAPIGKFSGHLLMAWLQIYHQNDWDKALREREVVLALNPNDPVAIAMMAELAIQAGKPDDAIASLRSDISWDSDYLFSTPHFRLGMAHFVKHEYQMALVDLKREPNLEPMYTLTFLAATYAQLGQIDEARAVVSEIIRANPEVSLSVIRKAWPFRNEADTEHLIGALRKAGLEE